MNSVIVERGTQARKRAEQGAALSKCPALIFLVWYDYGIFDSGRYKEELGKNELLFFFSLLIVSEGLCWGIGWRVL